MNSVETIVNKICGAGNKTLDDCLSAFEKECASKNINFSEHKDHLHIKHAYFCMYRSAKYIKLSNGNYSLVVNGKIVGSISRQSVSCWYYNHRSGKRGYMGEPTREGAKMCLLQIECKIK